jgi:Ca2+-binding RTX toxin-like protein
VVFGKSSGFIAAVNLSTLDGTDGFRMDGVDGGDQSGVSVSSAGDVNGDGLDDLIIGACGSDPGGDSTAGESYVVFGKSSGFTAAVDLATLDGTTGFRLDGIDAGDKSGCSVSSAGDVNGDGFDDLIIGAYGGDPGGDIDAGESYVIFGKSSGFTAALDLATLDGTNGFRLDGIDAGDAFGVSVSSTSDVNADGFDDFIIGARFADPDGDSGAGESYVVFGKSSGFSASLDLSTLNGTDGFRLDGTDANDRSGFSVSSAGDVNGDGFDDLIIGARFADPDGDSGAGESYVVFGKSSGFSASLDLSTLNGTDGFRLDGTDAGDLSGHSVSSAGDVNADGFDDLIIGALRGDPSGDIDAGESYVVFGNSSDFAAAVDLATLDSTDGFRLDGIDADDLSGRSVSSAGDVNGDGFDDLIIGADYANPGGDSGAGESYVVFGGNFTGGGETQVGDAIANTLTANQGVESVDILVGGQGSDTLISDGGQDVLYGGEGADTLAIVSTAFQRVAGGNGTDTLRLDGSGLTLDLTTLADNTLTDIEVIDISGSGNNSLSLNLLEVLNVSSHSNTLVVMRDAGDTVSVGTGWTQAGVQLIDGRFYQIRTQGAATLAVQESDFDFGDAPDSGLGTSEANYETTFNSGGPLHAITPGLFMGDTVDGDNGMQQDFAAGADDRFSAGEADDEDGVPNPLDLRGTIRAAPTVTLLVTNTTGAIATLAGWIDYNRNGVFENVTERATVTVATGTTDGRVTLTFPSIPDGSAGKTYARFRLSTDVAFAANPGSIGVATDGEVEDYVFSITSFGGTPVDNSKSVKIASETNGGPTLADVDVFGSSLASIGDVDGDGMNDLAVGAYGDDTGGDGRGAVHVLFLNSNGTVKSSTKIANETSGGPTLADGDDFGRSVTSVGDLNGDGVSDLAVGARGDDTGGSFRGAVHILFLNSNGTVKSSTKIANGTNGGPTLADGDRFGESIASVGDLDGDGVADLAVGATDDNTVGDHSGAVYVLFLNNDGTVKSATKIASDTGGGPTLSSGDEFGISVTSVGDIDGDGVTDLAVGADGDDTGFSASGAVHVLLLNSNGTVKSATKIANETNGGPTLTDNDVFGFSVTSVGDLDGDGVGDLAVGATDNDTGGRNRGAVYLLFLNSNGTVKSSTKIANETNGGPTLADSDLFGFSVTPVGDLDGDGVADLAVGARSDDTGGINRGAVHVLFLRGPQPETLSLPAGGDSYQVLTAGSDLVVRFAGGAEQFRQSAASISSLTINGSPNAEVVTVLNDAGVVATPISFIGGDGNDRFDATLAMGPVTLDGGGGDDTLLGGLQNDIMDGGDGADLVEISGPNIIVTNSSASRTDVDTLTSVERLILVASGTGSMIDASGFTLGPVTIVGSGGADTLKGGSGNDLILAGSGRDSVSGGAGNDFIMGNSGSDTLSGDSGNDTILGGRGRDSIDGGANPDHLRGGGGGDTIRGGDGNDRVMGGASRDVLDGDDGSDTLLGGGGRDNLAGGLGADNLNGSTRDDTFNQKVGPDTLIGGQRPSARPAPVTLLATSSNSKNEPPRSPTLIASAKAPEDIDDAFGDSLLPKLLEL